MSFDPRTTPSNGTVAHVSLKGVVEADSFAEAIPHRIMRSVTPILRTPEGPRDRELLFGEVFEVLEMPEDPGAGAAYGFARRDGYCGYVRAAHLAEGDGAAHRVAVRETYSKPTPDLEVWEPCAPLFFGSQVEVLGTTGDWTEIRHEAEPARAYLPSAHLKRLGDQEDDPVAVARKFIGAPYLWGGNSGRGIDCSGLVQAAFLACGVSCPGDSDLQEAMPWQDVGRDTLSRGDLLFWKGHVAIVSSPGWIIHANAHHMMVVEEPMEEAVARIAATETGAITSMKRPT